MHNEAEVAWCHVHREDVMRWLEERGGWQVLDWCVGIGKEQGLLGYVARWQLPDQESGSHRTAWVVVVSPDSGSTYVGPGSQGTISAEFVWLPAIGDILGLLERKGVGWYELFWEGDAEPNAYRVTAQFPSKAVGTRRGDTPLLALLELAKAVDDSDDSQEGGEHVD